MKFVVAIVAVLFSIHSQAAPTKYSKKFKKSIERIDRKFKGEFGFFVKHIGSGEEYHYNMETPYYLSSTVKLFVMVEIYKVVQEGRLSLRKKVKFTRADRRDGSKYTLYLKPGSRVRVGRLLRFMMQHSDNGAADKLISIVGTERINESLYKLGLPRKYKITTLLDVRRHIWETLDKKSWKLSGDDYVEIWKHKRFKGKIKVFKRKTKSKKKITNGDLYNAYMKYYDEPLNNIPLQFMAGYIEKLWHGKLLNKKYTAKALKLMSKCKTGRGRLKKSFPKKTWFAHKTGTQFRVSCDMGVVSFGKKSKYIVGVCARGYRRLGVAEKTMSRVGRVVASHLKKRK